MVFKMEDSGLPGPRNSGLVRALGGRSGPRQECGRRANPEPQKRDPGSLGGEASIWDEFPRLSKSSRAPLARAPRENTRCCLSCSVSAGRVCRVNIVPPPGTPAKWAFVYLRFEQKRKKKACLLKNTAPENSFGCGDLDRRWQGTFLTLC